MNEEFREVIIDPQDEIVWAEEDRPSRIGSFPLHIVRLMDCSPADVRNSFKRLEIAAGLYTDFRMEYGQTEWLADLRSGAVVCHGHRTIRTLFRLDDKKMLICGYHAQDMIGEARAEPFESDRVGFLPAVQSMFAALGRPCYPINGIELIIRMEDLLEELHAVARKMIPR